MTSMIGSKRRRFWDDNGFLVLPSFFTPAEVDAVDVAERRAWADADPMVIVDDLVTGRRCRITQLSDKERAHRFKVNDLYLTNAALRDVALSERLGMILTELLGDLPAICNTLNFDKGSQQADHLDTLYMTPRTDGALVATWMALEDADADSGPLRYYPGSNHIPPYRFSNGSMHAEPAEMERWSDYMTDQVERRGLEEQHFEARKGDLFIWHALLLHGGSGIADPSLTRRSLVTHYWTQHDCEKSVPWDLRPTPGGWWIRRPPQPVPGEVDTSPERATPADPPIDFPAELSRPLGDLRDRMDDLQAAID